MIELGYDRSKWQAGLADAARCRSESDWLIGINGTRALTKRMFGSRAGNVAAGSTFICGVPMKLATKRFAGRS